MKTKLLIIVLALLGPTLANSNVKSRVLEIPCEVLPPLPVEPQEFYVEHEAYLPNGVGTNLDEIEVKGGKMDTFLQFDLGTAVHTIKSVELQLTITKVGSGTTNIFSGSHADWTAGTLTIANKPEIASFMGSFSHPDAIGKVMKAYLNVDKIVDGKLTLLLSHTRNAGDYAFAGKGNSTYSGAKIIITYEDDFIPTEDLYGTLELIDPVTDEYVRDLETINNLTSSEASAMNMNAVPPSNAGVNSVVFQYYGRTIMDSNVPYSMFQDTGGDYVSGELLEGVTTVTVSYFSSEDGSGTPLGRNNIAFNMGITEIGGEFYPIEDAFITSSDEKRNFTYVTTDGGSVGYLQYDLGTISGTVTGAELQFTIDESVGSGTTNIFLGTHSDWTEGNLGSTMDRIPGTGEWLGSYSEAQNSGDRKKVSLKEEHISDGKVTLVLVQKNGNGLTFPSSESTRPSQFPVLLIEVDGDDGRDDSGDLHSVNDAHITNGQWNNNETILVQKDVSLGYLQFDLSEVTGKVTEAELWFTVALPGSGSTNLFAGSHSDWTEDDTSVEDAPVPTVDYLGNFSIVQAAGNVVKLDLQESVVNSYTRGQITIILEQKSGEPYAIASSENTEYGIKPILLLKVVENDVVCNDEPRSPYSGVTVSSDQNYILARTYNSPMGGFAPVYESDVIESITYFDGLGRPMQQVAMKASRDRTDLVTHIGYDGYGRRATDHLPYETGDAQGPLGSLRPGAAAAANTYYQDNYGDPNSYSEKRFEPSPLNRVLEQSAPGEAWKLGGGHTVRFDYATNTAGEVRLFEVAFNGGDTEDPQLSDGTTFYAAGELYKNVTRDENWTGGKNHSTEEFTDKQGRTVLKRTYADIPGTPLAPHDTYYVHDDFGNLTYVLPPKMNGGIADMDELAYQYRYDRRNRLVEKKIPGKGTADDWESIVYDRLDRPIMTQDPNLKADGEWLFTKYDAFGRVAYTGKAKDAGTRQQIQGSADAVADDPEQKLWVERGSFANGGIDIGYGNTAYPSATITEVLTINYYDDYGFDLAGAPTSVDLYNTPGTSTAQVKGLATGSRVKVLGASGNNWITTVTLYDDKARPVYVHSNNDYLATVDITKMEVDFAGRTQSSETTHTRNGTSITTFDTYGYDHMGRQRAHTQKIGDGPETAIACSTYDDLGQLTSKIVGGGLQTVDYAYNIRGWLTAINKDEEDDNDLFDFGIAYNEGAGALFNGNIARTDWATASENMTDNPVSNQYSYVYDPLNRITSATGGANSNYDVTGITYDKNGNIETLNRNGYQNNSTFTNMDVLDYDYDSGNKLTKVTDGGNGAHGFKDGTNTNDDFEYDENGNLKIDRNKGITGVTYNHLNLPEQVDFGSDNIKYVYDATGAKLKRTSSTGTETIYANGYIYEGGIGISELQFFSHPEGYVTPDGQGGYDYVYNYVDHLGSIRLSYTDADNDGNIDPANEIIEENNYYPFGLLMRSATATVSPYGNSAAKRWKFSGKELDGTFDIDTYDFGARNYDPTIGRWMNPDPLAELMRRFTPYNYSWNNPIIYVDPDGMFAAPPTDFYDQNGNRLGTDGVDDGKVVVVTDRTEARQIRRTDRSGGTTQVADVSSGVELPSASTRASMAEAVDRTRQPTTADMSTDPDFIPDTEGNFHEEGGIYGTDRDGNDVVANAEPGSAADLNVVDEASINTNRLADGEERPYDTQGTFHTHPGGEIKSGATGSNQIGSVTTKGFANPPSNKNGRGDIPNASNSSLPGPNVVLSAGNNKVYIYNGNGVQATFPLREFRNVGNGNN